MNTLTVASVAVAAYLIGSIPFAVVVSRLFGLADPRGYGSGNPGATNVLRSGNKLAALFTLLGDAFKGWLPVWLVLAFGTSHGLDATTAAVAGLGALLGFGWAIAFSTIGVWLAVAFATRYSSAAAIAAAVAAPALAHLLGAPSAYVAATVVMTGLLLWRHAANIKRLLAGTESRIGAKKS